METAAETPPMRKSVAKPEADFLVLAGSAIVPIVL